MRLLGFAVIALLACQKGAAPVPEAYRADLQSLCEAEKRSGALEAEEGRRALVVAQWLGSALTTAEARSFLVGLAKLKGAAKGQALRNEATRVGLSSCPLAEIWR